MVAGGGAGAVSGVLVSGVLLVMDCWCGESCGAVAAIGVLLVSVMVAIAGVAAAMVEIAVAVVCGDEDERMRHLGR